MTDQLSAEIAAVRTELQPALQEADALLHGGKLAESDAFLLAAVPAARRTAAHNLFLGDTLFRDAPELSRELHHQAVLAAPNDRSAILAWAMELHRSGAYCDATAPYQRVLESSQDVVLNGLLAECQLRCGKLAEAASSWLKLNCIIASDGCSHELSERFRALRAGPSALRQRMLIRNRIARGAARASELIEFHFSRDSEAWQWVELDLEWLDKQPGIDPEEVSELHAVVHLKTVDELQQAGMLIGPNGRLPLNSRLALKMWRSLPTTKPTLRSALLRRFGSELEQRIRAGDVAAAHLEFELLAQPDPTRHVDRWDFPFKPSPQPSAALARIWAQTHDAGIARLYVLNEWRARRLKADSDALTRALEQFPNDAVVAAIAADLARAEHKPLREPLVRALTTALGALGATSTDAHMDRIQRDFEDLFRDVTGTEPVGEVSNVASLGDRMLLGDQLWLMVTNGIQARRSSNSFLTKYLNVAEYLLQIDLTHQSEPLGRVIGPVWSAPEPIDQIDWQAGGASPPELTSSTRRRFYLMPTLGLVGEVLERDGRVHRKKLSIEEHPTRVHWTDIGVRERYPEPAPFYEPSPSSQSRRYNVPRGVLYDHVLGARRPDPWLRAVSADLRSRESQNLDNCYVSIDDDLQYVVALPGLSDYPIQYQFRPGSELASVRLGRVSDDFVIGGQRYQRHTSGIVYRRPALEPTAFARRAEFGVFMIIDGQPMMLYQLRSYYEIVDFTGRVRHHVDVPELSGRLNLLNTGEGPVLWFTLFDLSQTPQNPDQIVVGRWDLEQDRFTIERFDYRRFFHLGADGYEAPSPLAIEP